MKKSNVLCFCLSLFILSITSMKSQVREVSSIQIDTLLSEKISVRAIAIANDRVYYAGDKGRVGYIKFVKKNGEIYSGEVVDSLKLENRSIALTNNNVFVLNVGNPAKLHKYSKSLNENEIVYQENNEKVFYDSMQFWNDQEGIAVGDPIENCFSILITSDGGKTWKKVSSKKIPKVAEGEAAFAASNSNIVVKGNKTWIVSGGKKARVYYSSNKGKSWKVYDSPIVQGESMTGIFSADFYNEKIGFIAGGNFEKQEQNFQNKALSIDGGKTWKIVGNNVGFGYASCIQFVPNSEGRELVCVGGTGIYYSNDMGNSWKQLSNDKSFYTIRFIDENNAVAAGKNKIVKLVFK